MNIFKGSRRVINIFYCMGVFVTGLFLLSVVLPDNPQTSAKFMLMLTASGFPIFWGITVMVGYIARGFMDIPSGQDKKLINEDD